DLGFPTDATNAVKDLYTGATTRFRTPYGPTDPVPVDRGTIQGDSLSPFLFSPYLIYIEPLLRWLQFYFYGAEIAGLVVMLLLASGSREAAKVKVVLAGLTCTGVLTMYACWQAATQLKSFQAGKAEVVSGSFLAMTCINALATWRAYAARPARIKRE
ncbi:hypothetical protein QJQ45_027614, partial [Haematococcus lacustris]